MAMMVGDFDPDSAKHKFTRQARRPDATVEAHQAILMRLNPQCVLLLM
jgi:hypothetical protein